MNKIFWVITMSCFGYFNSVHGQSIESLNHWIYVHGQEDETLSEFTWPDFTKGDTVSLPHRLIKPKSVFWYQTREVLPGNGFLKIKADDGAQVWIGGRRIFMDKAGYFPFSVKPGETNVIIRALNNAMAGGLGKVEIISAKNPDTFKNQWLSDSLAFTFWGDSQGGWDTFSRIIRVIQTFNDPLTIGLGDLTANGSDLNQWFSLGKILHHPDRTSTRCLVIPGNHDYDNYYDKLIPDLYNSFYGREAGRTYFFEKIHNAAFLGLDINRNFPLAFDGSQRMFIDSVCSSPEWIKADWRFVLVHQPPYGQGWKGYSGEETVRDWLESAAKKYKIDVVLSGHIHDYERISKNFDGQETMCIVSGGAGGHLEPSESNETPVMDKVIKKHHFGRITLTPKLLKCKMYDTNGQVIDYFKMVK